MAESLGRIAQLLPADSDLLREHSEMIAEAEHVLEHADGSVKIFRVVDARSGECLDQPESAHTEGTFAAANTWEIMVSFAFPREVRCSPSSDFR